MAKTLKVLYAGDEGACAELRGFAMQQLDKTHRFMEFRDLKQLHVPLIVMSNGAFISISSVFGADTVKIYSPPGGAQIEPEEETIEKDPFIAYNIPERGGAFDTADGVSIDEYTQGIPDDNGDPHYWTTSKDTRLNILKSFAYNLSVRAGVGGQRIGDDTISIFHRKSINIDEYGNAETIYHYGEYVYYEGVHVYRKKDDISTLLVSDAAKTCNFFVEHDGSFWIQKLFFGWHGTENGWGVYITNTHYDIDGAQLSTNTYEAGEVGEGETYETGPYVWDSIDKAFNTVAFDGTNIYMGGHCHLRYRIFEEEFIFHTEAGFYDYDPVDGDVKFFAGTAFMNVKSMWDGGPTATVEQTLTNTSGKTYQARHVFNMSGDGYNSASPAAAYSTITNAFMGVVVWYDYAKRRWDAVDICAVASYADFDHVETGTYHGIIINQETGQCYGPLEYYGGTIVSSFPGYNFYSWGTFAQTLDVLDADGYICSNVFSQGPNPHPLTWYGPGESYDDDWFVYCCTRASGGISDAHPCNCWNYLGITIYNGIYVHNCPAYVLAGSVYADTFPSGSVHPFVGGGDEFDLAPASGWCDVRDYHGGMIDHGDDYAWANYRNWLGYPDMQLHYTIGAYRLLNTEDTYNLDRPTFDIVHRFYQRHVVRPDGSTGTTNYLYDALIESEIEPDMAGGCAKWTANGYFLDVQKFQTTYYPNGKES